MSATRLIAPSSTRLALAAAVVCAAMLAFSSSARGHAFGWDGSAADPKRPGVTLRWDRTLSSCGDTSPFRTLKVQAHQGQTPIAADQYMVVSGRRQVLKNGKWVTLPSSSDLVVKRGPNGQTTFHTTLQFYLRHVDKGMRSRVRVGYAWKQAAGAAGDAGDTVWARRTAYTRSCRVP